MPLTVQYYIHLSAVLPSPLFILAYKNLAFTNYFESLFSGAFHISETLFYIFLSYTIVVSGKFCHAGV
jgi:hypothetical protein